MIYMTRPTTPGNDFIYPDNYTGEPANLPGVHGQVDAQGKKFCTNTDTDGRFHSKWLEHDVPRESTWQRNLLPGGMGGDFHKPSDDKELNNLPTAFVMKSSVRKLPNNLRMARRTKR